MFTRSRHPCVQRRRQCNATCVRIRAFARTGARLGTAISDPFRDSPFAGRAHHCTHGCCGTPATDGASSQREGQVLHAGKNNRSTHVVDCGAVAPAAAVGDAGLRRLAPGTVLSPVWTTTTANERARAHAHANTCPHKRTRLSDRHPVPSARCGLNLRSRAGTCVTARTRVCVQCVCALGDVKTRLHFRPGWHHVVM